MEVVGLRIVEDPERLQDQVQQREPGVYPMMGEARTTSG
jgi:hypothetical protein